MLSASAMLLMLLPDRSYRCYASSGCECCLRWQISVYITACVLEAPRLHGKEFAEPLPAQKHSGDLRLFGLNKAVQAGL